MLKHVKLFEEFNNLSGNKFISMLRVYAEGSPSAVHVSRIESSPTGYSFSINSNVPAENGEGTKTFVVKVPASTVSELSVETYVSGEKVFSEKLEPEGENDINVILKNFIEAAQLYDDNVVEILASSHNIIHTTEDIHNLLKYGNYSPKKEKGTEKHPDRD